MVFFLQPKPLQLRDGEKAKIIILFRGKEKRELKIQPYNCGEPLKDKQKFQSREYFKINQMNFYV